MPDWSKKTETTEHSISPEPIAQQMSDKWYPGKKIVKAGSKLKRELSPKSTDTIASVVATMKRMTVLLKEDVAEKKKRIDELEENLDDAIMAKNEFSNMYFVMATRLNDLEEGNAELKDAVSEAVETVKTLEKENALLKAQLYDCNEATPPLLGKCPLCQEIVHKDYAAEHKAKHLKAILARDKERVWLKEHTDHVGCHLCGARIEKHNYEEHLGEHKRNPGNYKSKPW